MLNINEKVESLQEAQIKANCFFLPLPFFHYSGVGYAFLAFMELKRHSVGPVRVNIVRRFVHEVFPGKLAKPFYSGIRRGIYGRRQGYRKRAGLLGRQRRQGEPVQQHDNVYNADFRKRL